MLDYTNTDYQFFRTMLNKFMTREESLELGFECYGEIERDLEDMEVIVDSVELIGADNQKITFVFSDGQFSEWYQKGVNKMVRHIELTIDFDLTCWAESMEDFENDSIEFINEEIADYIINSSDELLEHLTIKKIWYEEED